VQALLNARYDLGPKWFVDAGARYLYASNLKLTASRAPGDA
jgi:hypothetical protein